MKGGLRNKCWQDFPQLRPRISCCLRRAGLRFARPDRRGRDSAGPGTDPPGSLANRFAHALAKERALLCGGAHRSARASTGLWYPILFSIGVLGFGPGFGLRLPCFPTLVPLANFSIFTLFCRPLLFQFVYRHCFWFSVRKSWRPKHASFLRGPRRHGHNFRHPGHDCIQALPDPCPLIYSVKFPSGFRARRS